MGLSFLFFDASGYQKLAIGQAIFWPGRHRVVFGILPAMFFQDLKSNWSDDFGDAETGSEEKTQAFFRSDFLL